MGQLVALSLQKVLVQAREGGAGRDMGKGMTQVLPPQGLTLTLTLTLSPYSYPNPKHIKVKASPAVDSTIPCGKHQQHLVQRGWPSATRSQSQMLKRWCRIGPVTQATQRAGPNTPAL